MLEPAAYLYSESDQFQVPPDPARHWAPQWHGRFATADATSATTFIAQLSVGCASGSAAQVTHEGSIWTVKLGDRSIQYDESGNAQIK
jgi:hypothetical protein